MNSAQNNNIDCVLMCAASSAYFVDVAGSFNAPCKGDDDFDIYDNLGVIGKVEVFTNKSPLLTKIDAAILMETKIGYVLSFRGTLQLSTKGHDIALIEDWGEDVLGSNTVEIKGLPGKVHEGFSDAFFTLWPKILKSLNTKYTVNKSNKPLYITGHSKGGPMASYAAYLIKQANLPLTGITTIASPFPGNQEFATGYNALITQTRFEYYLDLVPFLAPQTKVIKDLKFKIDAFMLLLLAAKLITIVKYEEINNALKALVDLNYQPVGTLKYITEAFDVVNDSPGLHDKRLKEFKTILAKDGFIDGLKRIGKSHSVKCGSGYQKGACAGVCMVIN